LSLADVGGANAADRPGAAMPRRVADRGGAAGLGRRGKSRCL